MRLKKIKIADLQIGMFVYRLDRGRLIRPFWFGAGLIARQRQIDRILKLGVTDVLIDLDRGIDTAASEPVTEPAGLDSATTLSRPLAMTESPADNTPRTLSGQFRQAKTVHDEAVRLVRSSIEQMSQQESSGLSGIHNAVLDIATAVMDNSTALHAVCHIKSRDQYLYQHAVACSALMGASAGVLGLGEKAVFDYSLGGLLFDLGMSDLPPELIHAAKISDPAQRRQLQGHVHRSLLRLKSSQADCSPQVIQIIAQHHERLDGSGYPRKLAGDQISRAGRMAAIVDVYDAMTSDRPHRSSKRPANVMRYLLQEGGTCFDLALVKVLIRIVGTYPVGTPVQLESGRYAVVIQQGTKMSQPVVRILFDVDSSSLVTSPEPENLAESDDRITGLLDPELWPINLSRYLLNLSA